MVKRCTAGIEVISTLCSTTLPKYHNGQLWFPWLGQQHLLILDKIARVMPITAVPEYAERHQPIVAG